MTAHNVNTLVRMEPFEAGQMIWIKSALVGLLAAIVAVVVSVLATTTWLISMTAGSGSGGIGAVSVGIIELVFLPAVLAFALAFRWMLRRQRRRPAL
jgi:hypothetical protein